MQIKELSTNKQTITRPTILIDWQKKITETAITVRSGQQLKYFFMQGIDNIQKRNITIALHEGSSLVVYGLMIGQGTEQLRTDLTVIHVNPRAHSSVKLKGVLSDHAEGKWNGTIVITPEGHLTDARFEERVLLLSDDAHAEAVPNLEIQADDVKASHAATVGKMSEEEIFYLQSRGLSRTDSQRLIIRGFIQSQLMHLPEIILRARLEKTLEKKLNSLTL